MIGLTITTRKPRAQEYETVKPEHSYNGEFAGISVEIVNTRTDQIYVKTKV
jgi:hypothetical protein